MKRSVQLLVWLLLLLGWQPLSVWGQDPPVLDEANAFVTRWKKNWGSVEVPLYGTYAYRWEKADGTEVKSGVATVAEGELLALPVPESGEYVLKAGPKGVNRIEFGVWKGSWLGYNDDRGTGDALILVEQWGSVAWTSFAGAFYMCDNLKIAAGAGVPNLQGVQDMQEMFAKCKTFNSPIGDWDVSKVTNMKQMFYYCDAFNQPLEQWDVSQVTSMYEMFERCRSFNQPLGKWDVSRVTDMYGMFHGCYNFNHPLEDWDVSKVTDMRWMFAKCGSFNQPLEKWNVSQVIKITSMFRECSFFNQPLEQWDVSRVEGMGSMFEDCYYFNQPLGGWTVSSFSRYVYPDERGVTFSNGMSVANYSSTLVAWAAKKDQLPDRCYVKTPNLWFDAVGKVARQQLIDEKGWTFEGDSEATLTNPAVEIVDAPQVVYLGVPHTFKSRVLPEGCSQEVTWNVIMGNGSFSGSELTAKELGRIGLIVTSNVKPESKRQIFVRVLQSLTGIALNPTSIQLGVGDTHALTVEYTPQEAINSAVTWSSSDENVAMVDAQGVVTGVKGGSAVITATSVDGGHTASCAVTVTVPLTGIEVSPLSTQLDVGSTGQLTVSYAPADATNKNIAWSSSDEGVATVDAKGMVTGVKAGTATITATAEDGGYTATCVVTVKAVPLTGIGIDPSTLSLAVNASQTLIVQYTPGNATNKKVTWSSSDVSVATVDEKGMVTGVKAGTATITATAEDGGDTATCQVEVKAVSLTGIGIDPSTLSLAVNASQTLIVQYTPGNATNKKVTWSSSDEGVATVDAQGVVTGVKAGSATITATAEDGGHKARCEVTVSVVLTGIAVSPANAQLKVGDTQQLTVAYTPADATNQSVTWSSSDEGVAKVDAQGVVTGVKAGSATITATAEDGGHKATCEVTVSVALTGIAVSPANAQLKVGETQTLTVGYAPEDATNKSVTWSSSDEGVAKVDAQGVVTGVKAGSATITATAEDGGHKASCEVTVETGDKPDGVESALLAGVTVSPNPFDGVLTVRGAKGVARYALVSATGTVVLEGAHDGASELCLETGRLAAGVYWLRLEAADGERVVQVVRR